MALCSPLTLRSAAQRATRAPAPIRSRVTAFACGASSNKVRQIQANAHVEVAFWESPGDLVVSGAAEVVENPGIKGEMWQDEWERYFPHGRDDPEYCLLKITPTKALYRDLEQHAFMPQQIL